MTAPTITIGEASTAGNNIGLLPNQISKVRVYIWLEGQDPDCIDMASTGDKLNVNLKLTKEANTIEDNGYTGQYTGGSGAGAGGGATYITADTLPVEDYGGYVTNYTPTNGENDEGIQWRIFYSDEENIYLIADTYVPLTNDLGTKNYILTGYTNTSGRYGFDLMSYTNYNGTKDIDSTIASKWLRQYTLAGYTSTSENRNAKATAYLLDTNVWSGFKDSTYAKYAVGAPTIELFTASYNKTHEKDIELQVEEIGYDVKWSDGSFGEFFIDGLNTTESLYVISDTFDDTVYGMWLASPSGFSGSYVMYVNCYGCVNYGGNDFDRVRCPPASFSKL